MTDPDDRPIIDPPPDPDPETPPDTEVTHRETGDRDKRRD